MFLDDLMLLSSKLKLVVEYLEYILAICSKNHLLQSASVSAALSMFYIFSIDMEYGTLNLDYLESWLGIKYLYFLFLQVMSGALHNIIGVLSIYGLQSTVSWQLVVES